MELYQLLLFFFIYAFLGWCVEVSYATTKSGKFVNRGFLNGPACPIYGFGVILVVYLLMPLKSNVLLLYLAAVLLTSSLEWITGFVLEKIFQQKWWSYDDMPFNLNGYVCLMFSLMWGLGCLLVVYVFHPTIVGVVEFIPIWLGWVAIAVCSVLITIDIAATVSTMMKLNRKLKGLHEIADKMREVSDDLGKTLSDGVLEFNEKSTEIQERVESQVANIKEDKASRMEAREAALKRREAALTELKAANEELMNTYLFGQQRLMRAYPNMVSLKYSKSMEMLKEVVKGKSHV